MRYVLFAARHETPTNEGALCRDYDFKKQRVVPDVCWNLALTDQQCELYVTGLTPALTEFVFEWIRLNGSQPQTGATLTLLHYDRKNRTYIPQTIVLGCNA